MFTGLIPILYNLYYAKDNYKTFFFFTELLGLKKKKKDKKKKKKTGTHLANSVTLSTPKLLIKCFPVVISCTLILTFTMAVAR